VAEPGSAGLWHAALFHRGAAEFETRVCQFARDAVQAGDAVLVTGPVTSLNRLRARLDGLGDLVTWADMAEIGANPGRLIYVLAQFAGQQAGRAIWCVQQAAWPSRPAEELWEVLRHEALINRALSGAPLRMLCPYDTGLPRELISCVEATHPVIAPAGRWQASPHYGEAARGVVPTACDQPLPAPPADAWALSYSDDLRPLRTLVSLRGRAAGLPPHRASDLLIAVGELTGNTLAHAGGRGTLTTWTTGKEIVCEVSDGGHITEPLAGRLRPDPAADNGGRGLWIVHQLCDLVQVRTGPRGTTIRVHMHLPTARDAGDDDAGDGDAGTGEAG
jgi:anti-sigma regulatory factor (Ser/Thr protein kinase)